MTDKEIIQALECCKNDDCDKCPNTFGNCYANLAGYTLGLIERQQAEIERLTDRNKRLCEGVGWLLNNENGVELIRAEAIKQFVNDLKCAINPFADYEGEDVWKIAVEVAEEMVGAE